MKRAKMIGSKAVIPAEMGFGSNTASGLRSSYLHLCIRYYGKCAGIWDILYVAYSLTIWIAAVPAWIRRLRNTVQSSRPVQKLTHTAFVERYQNDLAFRGSIRHLRRHSRQLFLCCFSHRCRNPLCICMVSLHNGLLSGVGVSAHLSGCLLPAPHTATGISLLSHDRLASFPFEHSHGRHDRADGAHKLPAFPIRGISSICRHSIPFTRWQRLSSIS